MMDAGRTPNEIANQIYVDSGTGSDFQKMVDGAMSDAQKQPEDYITGGYFAKDTLDNAFPELASPPAPATESNPLVQSVKQQSYLQQVMSGIARGVAHEFKNPLNAISLRLEVLRTRVAERVPTAIGDIDVLMDEVTRLDRVVRTFLDLSRPVVLELRQLQLADMVTDIVRLIEPEADRTGVRMVWSGSESTPLVPADADRMRQALLNVVRNSLDAMPRGGVLKFAVRQRDDDLEIEIADTGPGIPKEIRERIFEPYFSTKEIGSGIGLTLTMRTLQMHGGTVEVESGAGRGTTVRLRLPIHPTGENL